MIDNVGDTTPHLTSSVEQRNLELLIVKLYFFLLRKDKIRSCIMTVSGFIIFGKSLEEIMVKLIVRLV